MGVGSARLIYRGSGILHQFFTDTGGCHSVPASEDTGVLMAVFHVATMLDSLDRVAGLIL